MRLLVTGGAGFIGSHVCEALLERGDKVVCIDNFNDYYDPKQKEKNIFEYLKNPNFKLYRKDICDFNSLKKIFEKENPQKIIHLAARAGVRASVKQPLLYYETNVKGTLNLLNLAKEYEIKNFVFGSSSSVYGSRSKGPFSEQDRVDNPISPYAATKKAGEELCHCYHHLYNLSIICLRLFTVYGPRGRPDMAVRKFTTLINNKKEIAVYGDGTSQRDYTYVADVVDGILKAADKNWKFEIINLGNNKPIKLNYLIKLIGQNLFKKAKIRREKMQPGDVLITYADIDKANNLLHWKPKTGIEEGIQKFTKWYKEHG